MPLDELKLFIANGAAQEGELASRIITAFFREFLFYLFLLTFHFCLAIRRSLRTPTGPYGSSTREAKVYTSVAFTST